MLERCGAGVVDAYVQPGRDKVEGDNQARQQHERADPDERHSGIVTILKSTVHHVLLRLQPPAAAEIDPGAERYERLAQRRAALRDSQHDCGIIDTGIGRGHAGLLVHGRSETLVQNTALRSGKIQ